MSYREICLLACLACGPAAAAPPAPAVVYTKPDVVLQATVDPDDPRLIHVSAHVDIRATVSETQDAVLDFEARESESSVIEGHAVYEQRGGADSFRQSVRWELRVMGIPITYHTVYRADARQHTIEWSLDAERDNDLYLAQGRYEIAPHRPGTVRLRYVFTAGSRYEVAAGIRKRLASREVRSLLGKIRERAEQARARSRGK